MFPDFFRQAIRWAEAAVQANGRLSGAEIVGKGFIGHGWHLQQVFSAADVLYVGAEDETNSVARPCGDDLRRASFVYEPTDAMFGSRVMSLVVRSTNVSPVRFPYITEAIVDKSSEGTW